MREKYIQLFKQMSSLMEVLAEKVIDFDRKQNDEAGERTAKIMKNDYFTLGEKLDDPNYQFTKADCAKLLVAAITSVNDIENHIKVNQEAAKHYEEFLIPKLQNIVDNANTDEETNVLMEKIFLEENK